MTRFVFTRGEEVSQRWTYAIEANTLEEAQAKYDTMRSTGEFYDEATLEYNDVVNGWDEVGYTDEAGQSIHKTL